ncbi:phosphate ABC transporter permease PstA [Maricaulis sp. CAU 1757]
MTDRPETPSVRELVERRLAHRYRSEWRFRTAGFAAVATAIIILIVLLGSIVAQGIPALTTKEIVLPVELEEGIVDPAGDRSEESLRRGSYSRVLQTGMRDLFPSVDDRRELRALFGLYTPLNAPRLMDEVLERPGLVGSQYNFRMPLADDLDLYLKGRLVEDRIMRPDGLLSLDTVGDGVMVQSTEADFAGLVASMREVIAAEVAALRAQAAQFAEQAALLSGDDAAEAEARAARLVAQADARQALLAAEDGLIPLDDDLPSVLVETAGHSVRMTALAVDGQGGRGERLLNDEAISQVGDWDIYVIETPAARRRVDDQVIAWTRDLARRGVIETSFNTYLFSNADSREPELAGVKGALYGSILTMIVTLLISVPIGVFTALYLEEYAPKNRFTALIEVNINNLAAVPSIVFGLLGLAVFINAFGLPRSAPLVGGLVLSLMTLPTVIIATRAALKAVPQSVRQAALAVGASKTQTVFHHVLPLAAPGVLTGSIIGLAQALGETAPLLMIGMVAFIADAPSLGLSGFTEPATVMPVQIFLWSDGAERAFEARTAAAILVLLALMLSFNSLAIYLRRRFERRW